MTSLQHSTGMARANHNFKPKNRLGVAGVGVMLGLHLLIGYALVSGLARKAIDVVKKPLSVTIIQEVVPPPPPPPPPKIKRVVERVKPQLQAPPPPAYVPPPDIQPVATVAPAPAITAVQNAAPVAAPVLPSPGLTPTPPAAPARVEVGVACPGYRQTLQDALAGLYDKVGIPGSVKVQFKVRGDAVSDVAALSGPREYHRAVQSAVRRFTCHGQSADATLVVFDIVFRAE